MFPRVCRVQPAQASGDSHTGPGANSLTTHATLAAGPKFPLFPRPAILRPKEKSEPPARRTASSRGWDYGAGGWAGGGERPGLRLSQIPASEKGNCAGSVGPPKGTWRRHTCAPPEQVRGARGQRVGSEPFVRSPRADSSRPFSHSLALFFELLAFARLCERNGTPGVRIFRRVGKPPAGRGPAAEALPATRAWSPRPRPAAEAKKRQSPPRGGPSPQDGSALRCHPESRNLFGGPTRIRSPSGIPGDTLHWSLLQCTCSSLV